MKKLFKIILILLLNVIGILAVWVACDYFVYKNEKVKYEKTHPDVYIVDSFKYLTEPYFAFDLNTYFDGTNNVYKGRKPDGLQYSGKPITVFGCSFAYGLYLNANQTFTYKLSNILKRPVYNRAMPGKGFQQMYFQSKSEEFYRDVPPSDLVIYMGLHDHYRRMKVTFIEVIDTYMLVNYRKRGNQLKEINYNNKLWNIYNSSYTVKLLKNKFYSSYINNIKNGDKLTDEALLYFTGTRDELKKHWKNDFKFLVLLYPSPFNELLRKKLEDNGFVVINVDEDLHPKDLFTQKYTISETDIHPNEAAWDLVTPLIANKIKELNL